jgi:uncharacterized protein YdaU (DUF1376 family)
MNWYEKYIGDWLKKTSHLTMLEEGAYSRLVDWYYANECALPLPMHDVYMCARARTPAERRATDSVLRKFFELTGDGWHQPRADTIINRFQNRQANEEVRSTVRERQRKSREKRSAMFAALQAAGLNPPWNASTAQLLAMFAENGLHPPVTVTAPVTAPSHGTGHGTGDGDGHGSQTPLPNTHCAPVTGSATDAVTSHDVETARELAENVSPTRAGLACRAMRKAGLADVNPSHPQLLRLLAAGATDEELSITAAEASARGKGFAWALGTVEGRWKDAASKGPASRLEARQSAEEARVAAWAPALASKRS